MVTKRLDIEKRAEVENGTLTINKLTVAPAKPEKVRTYAHAVLVPGGEVEFHTHEGESESYYILSGIGTYNDNGTEITVSSGDVTFTPSGEGHGIKNTGTENLHFMALIVLE